MKEAIEIVYCNIWYDGSRECEHQHVREEADPPIGPFILRCVSCGAYRYHESTVDRGALLAYAIVIVWVLVLGAIMLTGCPSP